MVELREGLLTAGFRCRRLAGGKTGWACGSADCDAGRRALVHAELVDHVGIPVLEPAPPPASSGMTHLVDHAIDQEGRIDAVVAAAREKHHGDAVVKEGGAPEPQAFWPLPR